MTTDTPEPPADLQAIVRDYLKTALQADFEQHLRATASKPVYQLATFGDADPIDADLNIIDHLIGEIAEAGLGRYSKGPSDEQLVAAVKAVKPPTP